MSTHYIHNIVPKKVHVIMRMCTMSDKFNVCKIERSQCYFKELKVNAVGVNAINNINKNVNN